MRRITVLLSCLFLASVCYGLTLSEIQTEIRRNVKDTGQLGARQRFSDTILLSFINEGQRDVVNKTWCIKNTNSITLVADTTYYDLQSDAIAVKDAWFVDSSDDVTDLEEVLERSFRQSNPGFEDDAGNPTQYFIRITTSTADNLEMGINPVPNSASGTIYYDYFAQATDLSGSSDEPFEGLHHLLPYHDALIYYVTAKILLIEGVIDRASSWYQVYNATVEIMRKRLGEAPNYAPSMRIK